MQRMLLPLLMMGLASTAFAIEIDDPRFAAVDCWFDESQVETEADCYQFTLPQDHSDPEGRSISIPVLHVASEQPTSKAPLVQVGSGGLGIGIPFDFPPGINFWLNALKNISYQQGRDLYWFDVRGVGLAEPSLSCPQTIEVFDQYLAGDVSLAEFRAQHIEMLQNCGREFARQGVDFNHYTTMPVVEDIEQLRQAIEVPKLLLFGSSHGAVYAKEYAETYPDAVAGLILDSPLFMGRTQAQMVSEMGRQFERNVVAMCAPERRPCEPVSWMEQVQAMYESLTKSTTVGYGYTEAHGNVKVSWDDEKFLQLLLDVSAFAFTFDNFLPLWLQELEEGYDLAPLITMWRGNSAFDYTNYLLVAANECAEALPFTSDEPNGDNRLPWLEASLATDLSPLCETLAIEPIPESVYTQQVVAQPTLILHGSLDTLAHVEHVDRYRDRFEDLELVRMTDSNAVLFNDEVEATLQTFVDGLAH